MIEFEMFESHMKDDNFPVDEQIRELKRSTVRKDVEEAITLLDNFTVNITTKKKQPTFGEITFVHNDISKFNILREYV